MDLLAPWPLPRSTTLRPSTSGTNNRTYLLDAPAGARYVLRLYQNTRDPARLRYEHAILAALASRTLSFRVPAPIPTGQGDTLASLPDGTLAALFPFIAGDRPDRADPAHLRACGAALAELHAALRCLEAGPRPPGTCHYGDLDRVHPLVPEGRGLPGALALSRPDADHLAGIFERLRAAVPGLYATLPAQLCHNDYGPGNTVQVGGRTSGVFDFEFAGPDLRAIDVAVGWYWSVGPAWGGGGELTPARAFLDGYAAAAPLDPAERDALPTLSLLQRATAIVHWTGRHRAALAPAPWLDEQVQRLLSLDRWLSTHADQLTP